MNGGARPELTWTRSPAEQTEPADDTGFLFLNLCSTSGGTMLSLKIACEVSVLPSRVTPLTNVADVRISLRLAFRILGGQS